MDFPWAGKKKEPREAESKADFPAAFDMEGEGQPRPGEPCPEEGPILALTQRLARLGEMLDEAKEQVTAYLIDRESKLADADAGKVLARRLDSLVEKLDQLSGGGSRSLEVKLDALYGKLDLLAAGASRPASSSAEGPSAAAAGASEAAVKALVKPLLEKLEQVDAKCKTLADRTGAIDALKEAFVPNLVKVRDSLAEQHTAIGGGIRQLQELVPQYFNALPQYFTAIQQQVAAMQQHVDAGLRTVVDRLCPPEPEPSAGPAVSGDWQHAILGPVLAEEPGLRLPREQLLGGVLSGEPSASTLAGHLLIFRSAPVERMPALLKDIGEAYYRWQPRTTNKPSEMERSLVAWLQHACDAAGVSNTIELVHPGERFDSTRHNASERGVEITQVLGWIVLRDNGKVYTKASVAVK